MLGSGGEPGPKTYNQRLSIGIKSIIIKAPPITTKEKSLSQSGLYSKTSEFGRCNDHECGEYF